ncbi:transcriptional regulator, TetR family (plasmid) [Gloeothece citriformis PCC 7424]|uniref:Transcriptional regulator, TetR family n=1 Tax=Gloeothece citriformis (strain PCC 7424) TaxID=65393 RepID=B7KLW0_GLOC7|nr:TetR/AcrR family transcriptional regulator [Gloeothece citriformis]ACK73782.1 transcriptional regulator, TetR family [Gloeothece citriformis PCC 7424]
MARHKEFNQLEALSKAMETFWRYGYSGTSIQDLTESMGINRGSLYDTFGDKRSLFLAAIAHYDETVLQRLISDLEDQSASKEAIIAYFHHMIERIVDDKTHRGCFAINTAVELCPHDRETQQRIAKNLQRIEDAFYQALVRATQKGEMAICDNLRE